jgi:hypothetical protein
MQPGTFKELDLSEADLRKRQAYYAQNRIPDYFQGIAAPGANPPPKKRDIKEERKRAEGRPDEPQEAPPEEDFNEDQPEEVQNPEPQGEPEPDAQVDEDLMRREKCFYEDVKKEIWF